MYAICERETYAGDLSATVIRLDLERTLASKALTPRQRVAIALYYFAGLTYQECATVLGVSHPAVLARIKTALPNIAAHMNGESVSVSQLTDAEIDGDGAVAAWISDVAMNETAWWRVSDETFAALNAMFPVEDFTIGAYAAESGVEYPILTDNQMRHQNRNREISCIAVHRQFPFEGTIRDKEDGHKMRMARPS